MSFQNKNNGIKIMYTRITEKEMKQMKIDPTQEERYGNLPPALRQGVIDKDMQNGLKIGIFTALFAILGIGAFTLTSFIGAPFVVSVLINAWFAGSNIYLAGLTYGIINDLIAVRWNLPYFLIGHNPGQRSLLKTNDPNTTAIGWGILATFFPSLIATVLFTAATLITGFIGLPFAGFVLPAIALAMPLALIGADLFARYRFAQRAKDPQALAEIKRDLQSPYSFMLDPYQTDRLAHWIKTPADANAWHANSDRNLFGYLSMPLLGIAGLTSIITVTAMHALIPALLFSATFSVFPPIGLGLLLATGILAACTYLYFNRNKKVANGFQLDFPDDKPKPNDPSSENDQNFRPELGKQNTQKYTNTTSNILSEVKIEINETKATKPPSEHTNIVAFNKPESPRASYRTFSQTDKQNQTKNVVKNDSIASPKSRI